MEQRHKVPPQLAIASGNYSGAYNLNNKTVITPQSITASYQASNTTITTKSTAMPIKKLNTNSNTNQKASNNSTNTVTKSMLPTRLCNSRTTLNNNTYHQGKVVIPMSIKAVKKPADAIRLKPKDSSMMAGSNALRAGNNNHNISKIIVDNENSSRKLTIHLTDHDEGTNSNGSVEDNDSSSFLNDDMMSCEGSSTSSHYTSLFTR